MRPLLSLLFLTAVSSFAQSAAPVPSPFAIRTQIQREHDRYDLAALMRRLRLPVKFAFEGSAVGFHRTSLYAEVHPYTYGVYLLEVCYEINRYCRLIAFEGDSIAQPEESWKIRGYIDDANWRGLHFDRIDGWFVLQRHMGSGTGVAEYEQSWFELTAQGFEERLRNTAHGHRAFAGEVWSKWSVHLLSRSFTQSSASMTFLYYLSFQLEGPNSPPMDVRRLVTFTRPNGSPRYEFDPAHSELTLAEIARFCSAQDPATPAQIRAFVNKKPNPLAPPR